MRFVTLGLVCALIVACAIPAAAQQPFSFVIAAPDRDHPPRQTRTMAVFTGQRLDPLTGIETTRGRFTIVAMEDSRFQRRDGRQVRQAELQVNLWGAPSGARLAVGTGVRRESQGANVLMTRVVAEASAFAGRVISNVVLEKPLASNRDAMDVITTLAYTQKVSRGMSVGLEALFQDIEGFWNAAEAEGGARLFVGPSIDLAPATHAWALHVTAGRDIRATRSIGASDAFRALGRPGFVMRLSAAHRF